MTVTRNMGSARAYFSNSVAGSSVERTQTAFHTGRDRLTSSITATLVKASKPVCILAIANFFKVDADCGARVWEKMDAIVDEEVPEKKMKANGPAAELNPPRKPFTTMHPLDDLNPLSRHFTTFGI